MRPRRTPPPWKKFIEGINCVNCDGSGVDPDTANKCLDCKGTGKMKVITTKETPYDKD